MSHPYDPPICTVPTMLIDLPELDVDGLTADQQHFSEVWRARLRRYRAIDGCCGLLKAPWDTCPACCELYSQAAKIDKRLYTLGRGLGQQGLPVRWCPDCDSPMHKISSTWRGPHKCCKGGESD